MLHTYLQLKAKHGYSTAIFRMFNNDNLVIDSNILGMIVDRSKMSDKPSKNIRKRYQVMLYDNEQTVVGLYRSLKEAKQALAAI